MLNRNGLFFVLATIIIIFFPFIAPTPVIASSSSIRLQKAASYLISMYNPTLGLIANSEDEGHNPFGEEGVPCTNTYWIYSDNLWAGWALRPFNSSIAENVTYTVQGYVEKYGRSMLFEAAIGEPVPTTIHAKKNIKVYDGHVNGNRIQILLDRHQYADNPGVFDDAEEYADLCFYMTVNYWMMNDTNASMHWFRTGKAMWNSTTNKGFYDKAAKTDGRYQNFKLGLFLLAQRVTGFSSDIIETVETTAWSYQNTRGGITTQCWLNGSSYGTANTETTAALLLAYNYNLTSRLHKRQSYAEYMLEELTAENFNLKEDNVVLRNYPWLAKPWPSWFTILLVTTFASTTFSFMLIIREKRRRN